MFSTRAVAAFPFDVERIGAAISEYYPKQVPTHFGAIFRIAGQVFGKESFFVEESPHEAEDREGRGDKPRRYRKLEPEHMSRKP